MVTPTVSCFGFCGRPVTCGRMHGPPPQRTAQHHRCDFFGCLQVRWLPICHPHFLISGRRRLHAPKLTVVSGRHARHQDRCTRLRHRYNFVQRSRRSTNIQALFTGAAPQTAAWSLAPIFRLLICETGGYLHLSSFFTDDHCMLDVGIVQGKACVMEVDSKESFSSLKIEFPHASVHGVQLGASVAINGTCLTVRRTLVLLKRI